MSIQTIREHAARIIGFAAFLAVSDFLFWGGAVTMANRPFSTDQIYACFTIPCFAALSLTLLAVAVALTVCDEGAVHAPQSPHAPTGPKAAFAIPGIVPHIAPAVEALGLGGGLCALATLLSAGTAHPALLVLASAALGLGLAAGFFCWARALRPLETGQLVTVVGSACVLFPLVSLATAFAPALASYLIAGMLACCSVALCPRHLGSTASDPVKAPSPGAAAPCAPTGPAAQIHPSPSASASDSNSVDPPALDAHSRLRALWAAHGATALSFGSLGFVAGLSRMVSLSNGANGTAVMLGSPAFTLIAGLATLVLWHRFGRLVSPIGFFQAIFPFAVSGFALFSLTGLGFSTAFACFANFFFEFMLVVITIHGMGRPPHASAVAPAPYCLALGVAFALACAGTIVSLLTKDLWQDRVLGFVLSIVVCIYVLSMALMLLMHSRQNRASTPGDRQGSEFTRHAHLGSSDPGSPGADPGCLPRSSAPDPAASIESAISSWAAATAASYDLTPREREILALILQGVDTPTMAARLSVSDNTVRTHKKRLYRKLDVHSKQELLAIVSRSR